MDSLSTICVSSVGGVLFGLLGKILWDWLQSRGGEAKAVTAVLLENISRDIEKIQKKLDSNFDHIYERLRLAEITIAKNNEQIEMMKEK